MCAEDRTGSRQKEKLLIGILVWAQGELLEEYLQGLSFIKQLGAAAINSTDSKRLQLVRFLELMKGQSST